MENEYQDVLSELKEIKELIKELRKDIAIKDKKIEELESLILNNKQIDDTISEELSVLNSNDPELCYNYVLKNPNCNKEALSRKVIASGSLNYNHLFMKNIKDGLFDEHLQVILNSKDPEYCYYAALLKLDKEKVDLIRKIIIDSKSVEYCYEFANDIRYIYDVEDDQSYDFLDVTDLEQVIIDKLDIKYSYMFAKNVEGADVDILEQLVLDLASIDNLSEVFNFGIDVKGANLNECKNKIIELYNLASIQDKKEIIKKIELCEKRKIKCLFRSSFGEPVVIK